MRLLVSFCITLNSQIFLSLSGSYFSEAMSASESCWLENILLLLLGSVTRPLSWQINALTTKLLSWQIISLTTIPLSWQINALTTMPLTVKEIKLNWWMNVFVFIWARSPIYLLMWSLLTLTETGNQQQRALVWWKGQLITVKKCVWYMYDFLVIVKETGGWGARISHCGAQSSVG